MLLIDSAAYSDVSMSGIIDDSRKIDDCRTYSIKKHRQKSNPDHWNASNGDMLVMQDLADQFEKEYPYIDLEWWILDENTLLLRLLSDLVVSDGQFDVITTQEANPNDTTLKPRSRMLALDLLVYRSFRRLVIRWG